MPHYNKIIMIGHLTRDVQVSYTPSQTAVADFGIATNRTWTDQGGQKREEVCFVDCKSFGKLSETLVKFFGKGKPILVEGRLAFDQWEDQQGNKRSKHRIIVESFAFVGDGGGKQSKNEQQEEAAPRPWTPSGPDRGGEQEQEDVPF